MQVGLLRRHAISALHNRDWKEAEEQFRLARTSESLSPDVHYLCAMFYFLARGRVEEAIEEMAKAIAQDPLNTFWRARQAWFFFCRERFEGSIAEARKGLEFDNQNYQAHMIIGFSLRSQGKLAEALEEAEEVFRLAPFDSLGRGFLAGLLAKAGERERAEKLIATMTGAIPIGMMMYHLVCGEVDAAIDWYEKDIELRRPNGPMIAFAGFIKPLRASPRWPKVARMMNLPE